MLFINIRYIFLNFLFYTFHPNYFLPYSTSEVVLERHLVSRNPEVIFAVRVNLIILAGDQRIDQ